MMIFFSLREIGQAIQGKWALSWIEIKIKISNIPVTSAVFQRLTSFLIGVKNHELSAWLKNCQLVWPINVGHFFIRRGRMTSYWKKERKKATFLCVISESAQFLRVPV